MLRNGILTLMIILLAVVLHYFNEDGTMATAVYADTVIDPDKPMIALTWDDGPSNATSTILDALAQVDGRATFFVVGNRVEIYADTVKRAVEMGCEIGNHTWEHRYLDELTPREIKEQLNLTNDMVEELTGVRPKVMRPTGGRVTDTVRANTAMPMIYWTVDTEDWKTKNIQSTINNVLNYASDGAIILMHDLYGETAAAAQQFIPELVKRGYQLVTVSEMAVMRGGMENGVVYYNFPPQDQCVIEN